MNPDQKRAATRAFATWRAEQYRAQMGRRLLAACQSGDTAEAQRMLAKIPDLVEFRSPEGWTPLILASFGQHCDVVKALLHAGADPNACGKNGTTVLMYAKTALIGQTSPDFGILRALIEAGADPWRHDALGKDIFHYLQAKNDTVISQWLANEQATS
jgi:ankyrin repeat protein